ncbi:MAG TPA: ATP-binding cassette domain-containing protein [Dictyoglomaceae bacterium]|nr:ATP-binding cassette domain-containing protein [Dictyoglomaceae bacterium]
MSDNEDLLRLENVTKVFRRGIVFGQEIIAVNNISFKMSREPEILTIAGESGCGKTTLAKIILHIIEPTKGKIFINGQDMTEIKSGRDRVQFTKMIQPIFQNPYETFNPLKKIEIYLYDTAKLAKEDGNRSDIEKIIEDSLTAVGLSLQEIRDKYPHEFSGGQLQRLAIARALILNPNLLIADEPVSMLDVSLRLSILNLFKELKNNKNLSIVYITHDLSTAYYVGDRIAIMFRGSFVELGTTENVLNSPLHPYTQLLRSSILKPTISKEEVLGTKLETTPAIDEETEFSEKGCKFSKRCPNVMDVCVKQEPPIFYVKDREVKCWLYSNVTAKAV